MLGHVTSFPGDKSSSSTLGSFVYPNFRSIPVESQTLVDSSILTDLSSEFFGFLL